ncbi:MAG: sensor histidine kinase [Rubrobacteraceae bacterium]
MTTHPIAQEPPGGRGPGHAARRLPFGIGARGAARLAWSVGALCVALLLSGYLLSFLTDPYFRREESLYLGAIYNALQLAFPTVGAFVAARRPENPIGWLFCLASLSLSGQIFADSYATYALFTYPGELPGVETMAWLSQWIAFPVIMPVGALLFLLFPDGRLLSRWWRFVAWTAVAGGVLLAAGDGLRPGPLYMQPGLDNPLGVWSIGGVPVYRVWETCAAAGGWLGIGSCAVSVVSLMLRLKQARGEVRRQIQWFATAAVVSPTGFLVAFWTQDGTINGIAWFAGVFGFLMLPGTVGIAILRHHLWDMDFIVNRTLVYGTLTAIVVGSYALVVGILSTLFQTSAGTSGMLVPVLATGVIAVLFTPVRNRLQRSVNRLMYGERDDPYAVLSRLGERLETALVPEVALETVVETVAQALKLPYSAIALKRDGRFVTAAEFGTVDSEPIVLPLTHHSEEVGQLVLVPRSPGEELSPVDLKLLGDLARQAGAAAHAARLTADLQRSRERLVTAREEERRRLRRDLHDGLGPTLGGLTLGLDAARSSLAQDPETAGALLSELKSQTQHAMTDIRRLVHGLRPPALDDLGLVDAIRQQAARHGALDRDPTGSTNHANGTVFSVEAPQGDSLPPLPAAVEVACYRIAQEAITNVSRHAGARACLVRLSPDERGGELQLEVTDDGVGVPEDRRAGVGLSSMRERAEELGGTLTVGPVSTGGTSVLARLPLPGKGE